VEQYIVEDSITNEMAELNLDDLQRVIHASSRNAGWWKPPTVESENGIEYTLSEDQWLELVTPTKISLIHSEVSEAMEGFRKGLQDDHLPHRLMAEVELADSIIRALDLAGAHGFDMMGAVQEKLMYNWDRADHKIESREAAGGKKF